VPFTVVGVLDRKGQSPTGQDQDDVILLPISTAKRKVLGAKSANADAVDSIIMKAKDSNQVQAAQDGVKALPRQRHHLAPSEGDDFSIRNMEEIFAAQEASSRIMSIMLAAVASVSLIVGGIGIMNIMLVSVRERTREIGLRKALGARRRIILFQFLVESVTLTTTGGLVGMAMGFAAAFLIAALSPLPYAVKPWSIVAALAIVFGVGIFFGLYPASRAARLQPVEALRRE
jgi:putative ABC transport system permease protein